MLNFYVVSIEWRILLDDIPIAESASKLSYFLDFEFCCSQ